MAGYTRQSTYTDGDIIDAADSNDEFDQLLAAFNASSGHSHDGTSTEGAPITKLLSNTLTFGAATSGTDITVTFDGESNDGVLKWMEDEDYFEFSDDILVASTEKIQFRDTAIYINSSADGQLDLVADTEIQIAATTIDINGAADISGNLAVGGNLTVAGNATVTGTTTFNGGTLTLGDSASDNIVFGADVDSHIIPDDDDTYDLGSDSQQWRNIYIDGSAYIDGLAEDILVATDKKVGFRDSAIYINSSADGQLDIVADTEIQIAATTIDINGAINASGEIIAASLDISGDIDVDGTTNLDVVDIDGAVDMASTLAVTGIATFTDDIIIGDGKTIGSASDVDAITIASNGQVTLTQTLIGTALDISGDIDVDGTTNLDIVDIDGAVNIAAATTVATDNKIQFRDTGLYINSSADGQLDIVADTEVQIAATTVDINGAVDVSGNLSVGGNLDVTGTFDLSDSNFTNAGDIQLDSITGDSDTNTSIAFSGSDVITVTTGGETQVTFNNGSILPTTNNDVDLGSDALEFKDLYIDGTAYVDAIDFNGTAITATAAELNIMDGVTSTAAELNILDGVTSTAAELNILDGVTSTAAELNILDGVTTTTAEINLIDGDTSRGTTAVASGDGILINDAGTMRMTNVDTVSTYFASHSVGGGNIVTTGALNSGSITSGFGAIDNGASNITTTGVGAFGSLDISGDIDVDGTTNLDVVDIDGAVDMASTLQVDGIATFTVKPVANAGISVKNGTASAGFIEFFEDSNDGSSKVTVIAPALAADATLTLPAVAGTVATTDDATALAIALG